MIHVYDIYLKTPKDLSYGNVIKKSMTVWSKIQMKS